VNNASALWWQDMVDTPLKKYDLIQSINARGSFAMTQVSVTWGSFEQDIRLLVVPSVFLLAKL